MSLTRRAILTGAVASGAALGVTAIPVAQTMSADKRAAFHLAQFKAAMEEIDPSITSWSDYDIAPPALRTAFALTATRHFQRYDGDGWYDVKADTGFINVHRVTLLPGSIDGRRTFRVRPIGGDPVVMTEPRLNEFIYRRSVTI